MIVVDTNVLSELLRPKPADAVRQWVVAQRAGSLFTTTICEAELLYGLLLMPAGRRRSALELAIAHIFDHEFGGRVLAFDSAAARAYASIAARRRQAGQPIGALDAQIAAIAISCGAAVATRNVPDFADCGVTVVSPWDE